MKIGWNLLNRVALATAVGGTLVLSTCGCAVGQLDAGTELRAGGAIGGATNGEAVMEKDPSVPSPIILPKDRTVLIVGAIGEGGAQIAGQIVALAAEGAPIWLVINSPGGMVSTGLMILDAMEVARAQGALVNCLVAGKAFSMAFNILTACSSVYSLPNAEFLFHPIRIFAAAGYPITSFTASQLATELGQLESHIIPMLRSFLKMGPQEFLTNYLNETLWTAEQLNEAAPTHPIQIVRNVTGIPQDAFSWPASRKGLFGATEKPPITEEYRRFYLRIIGGEGNE